MTRVVVLIVVASLLPACFVYMATNWSRIDAENNAFAKQCNDRGGVAHFGVMARQCIGAKDAPGPSGEKPQ